MKIKTALFAAFATASVALAGAPGAEAADLPCRTAKLIVPWGAGGGTDVIFRQFVESANAAGAKPQIQVVNIGGQGGNKGAKEARGSKPDGCTLFAIHQSALTSFFNGRVDFTWDAFEPVALLTRTPAIIGANPDVPYNNVKELVEAAKKAPGTVVAGGTLGSTSHFIFLLLEDAAGVKFKHVSYDGTRERMTALLAKNIEIGEINLAAAKKYIQTNELKALGITTPARNPEIPDVMTLQEQGYDLIYGTDRGIVLPKGASQEVIDHYAAIFEKAAQDPKVVEAMTAKGTAVNYLGPKEYTDYFEKTFAAWKRIAIEVGLYKGS
ncbi:MAG: tripartite tricarboxylate transporter substrate binding protein [Nisaea sp.]|jgi:tripartite-type tricarboxylate transporter receptor subunit TctC|uniref:Bug family tripartite tricarboxylate transporter substrate binding protein n=1 Tax=Nisaea sp. TaxID=2024842 RepID=UPI001B24ACD3|nr:tripartite tricarboxylate transporter substrate binding protein [Nisaea sp.]MBO6561129.1 tripartite tricarboxylate transporter substrate binding protein [Nisaea sp.]